MAKKNPAIDLLGQVSLFHGLSKKELERILVVSREVDFKQGAVIATEGEPGNRFYLILDGTARVTIKGRTRASLGPGDHFGEMALLDGGPRTATVIATSDLHALSLVSSNFTPLLKQEAMITYKLLLEMSRRLRAANKSLQT